MLLTEINIKKAYSSDDSNILEKFYIPALECAQKYSRLTGYFSSTSLFLAARGISGLIKNHGTIRLIASPFFSADDIEVILNSKLNEAFLSETLIRTIDEEELTSNHNNLELLANLLETSKLEIKIAVVFNKKDVPLTSGEIDSTGIFHQKVGILTDSKDNTITFSGSINETAAGWTSNIEEFKVFRGWIQEEEEYVQSDIIKFEKYWNGIASNIKIYNLPTAVKEHILKINTYTKSTDGKLNKNNDQEHKTVNALFGYQQNAILSWENNNYKGIFEMATGSGKTYTALNCCLRLFALKPTFITIISCPYNHLLVQWEKEIRKLNIEFKILICDSSNSLWKEKILEYLTKFLFYDQFNFIILTTHTTLSSEIFRSCIERFSRIPFFLIADEVHGLGANISKKGLLSQYIYRLGLSATPKRWFDEEGTEYLYEYFDKVVFEFTLKDAITQINPLTKKTYLTPYYYKIKFTILSDVELQEYLKFTRRILVTSNKSLLVNGEKILRLLIFKRSNIIKNCSNKLEIFKSILEEIQSKEKNLCGTIVYCSPQQMPSVVNILNDKGLIFNKITMNEGTNPLEQYGNISQREYILNNFASGDFQVLIAIKCLDEGVDIPMAKNAILLSSSGNPREYIQRIGRVIRRYKDKTSATIYDILVSPSQYSQDKDLQLIEEKIFDKEMMRVKEIAINSINNIDIIQQLSNIKHT